MNFENKYVGAGNKHIDHLCQWPICKKIAASVTKRGIKGKRVYLCDLHKREFIELSDWVIPKMNFQRRRVLK